MPELDFVIVTALSIESEGFDAYIKNKQNYFYHGMSVNVGIVKDKKVAVVIAAIGETNAAIAATLMIQKYQKMLFLKSYLKKREEKTWLVALENTSF